MGSQLLAAHCLLYYVTDACNLCRKGNLKNTALSKRIMAIKETLSSIAIIQYTIL
jgi:hypothetical protein